MASDSCVCSRGDGNPQEKNQRLRVIRTAIAEKKNNAQLIWTNQALIAWIDADSVCINGVD